MIAPKGFSFWILVLLFGFNEVNAATLITFDDPYLLMVHDGNRLNGYYGLSLPDTGIRGPVSCEFFITASFRNANKIQFVTYMTDTRFLNRYTQMDLPGDLNIDGGRWEFRMDRQQGGCDTAAGGDFRRESASAYTVTKIIPVIGIFTIKKKVNFFSKQDLMFRMKASYLLRGDVVVAFKREKGYLFVDYFNSETSRHSSGWIRSEDLTSPFPE